MSEENKNDEPKEPSILLDIVIGSAIALVAYFIMWGGIIDSLNTGLHMLVMLGLMVILGFLTVKFFRTRHVAAAVILLVFMAPNLLILTLMGACGIMQI